MGALQCRITSAVIIMILIYFVMISSLFILLKIVGLQYTKMSKFQKPLQPSIYLLAI